MLIILYLDILLFSFGHISSWEDVIECWSSLIKAEKFVTSREGPLKIFLKNLCKTPLKGGTFPAGELGYN